MALKVKLGDVTGTRQAPSLSVTVFDNAGPLDRDAALAAALAAAPAAILGASLRPADVSVADRSHQAITFDLGYERPGRNILRRAAQEQTRPKRLYHFIAPVGVYDVGGEVTSSYTKFKSKLDRQAAAHEYNAGKPIVVDPLGERITLTFSTSQAFITDAYLDTICDLVEQGAFNDSPYLNRAAGEVQLVRFSAAEHDADVWELAVGFGVRKFRASYEVADGITIPELRGCDHWWPIEEEDFEDGKIQPVTRAVVVGQAWPLATLQDLDIPMPGYLFTRSSATAGELAGVPTGHGIEDTDECMVFWDGGSQRADVDSVGANSVTFSGGSGDALPPTGTRVLVAAVPS